MQQGSSSWIPVASVLLAFVVSGVIIHLCGLDVISAAKNMIEGSLGSKNAIAESLLKMGPLIFTGLAYALAARCGLVNIGAEGQLYIGGLTAALVGIYIPNLPAPLHQLFAVLAGFVGGGLWGFLSGWLKVRFGSSEVITTIMLNYVAQYLINYLVSGPLEEPPGTFPQSRPIVESSQLTRFLPGTRLHIGIFIALLCLVLFYFFLWKTTHGYETRVVGANPEAASYAGMKPSSSVLLCMFLAGGCAGLAGATDILGIQWRLMPNFSNGAGFDGIAVALLGHNTPLGIFFAAALFGIVRSGANLMQMLSKVPVSIVNILQALVVLFVAASNIVFLIARRRAIARAARRDSAPEEPNAPSEIP